MTTPERPHTGHGPAIGSINVLEATIGQRGMGKSTYQCKRVFDLVREHHGQAYVLGHSLGARLPSALPAEMGGAELPIEYHKSIANLDRALHERPTKWHVLAPPIDLGTNPQAVQDSCDDLIKYSIRLSESLRERAYAREHPVRGMVKGGVARKYDGLPSPFIAIIVDEGIAIESAGKGTSKESLKKKDWFLQWIYSLRHFHTALFYAIQNATARNWQLLSEATRVVVFRVKHQWAINAVQAAGGTHAEMRAVRKLAPHHFIALGEDPRLADEDEDDDDEIDDEETDEPIDKGESSSVQ